MSLLRPILETSHQTPEYIIMPTFANLYHIPQTHLLSLLDTPSSSKPNLHVAIQPHHLDPMNPNHLFHLPSLILPWLRDTESLTTVPSSVSPSARINAIANTPPLMTRATCH